VEGHRTGVNNYSLQGEGRPPVRGLSGALVRATCRAFPASVGGRLVEGPYVNFLNW